MKPINAIESLIKRSECASNKIEQLMDDWSDLKALNKFGQASEIFKEVISLREYQNQLFHRINYKMKLIGENKDEN